MSWKIFKDQGLPWTKNKVKTIIQEKNKIYRLYLKNKSNILVIKLETLQKLIYETLESCKSWYFEKISRKLCSKAKPLKYYWSLLKTTLNDKKNYCIPSIIHGSKFVIDFIKKVDLIDSFFQNSAQLLKITVFSLHQLIPLLISTCQILN